VPDALFYEASRPYSTIRLQPYKDGNIVLIGGLNHKTGQGGDIIARYRTLEDFARRLFNVTSILYHWTTQDTVTMDAIPYIGKITSAARHIYVATGFGGWGMTNGTVAGMLLTDMIIGRNNPWSTVFDATRIYPTASAKKFTAQHIDEAKEWVKGIVAGSNSLAGIANGEARVIEHVGKKTGVYKDIDGVLHAVSITCTHMGCTLQWDNAEKTWDCPCHGSRFTYDGNIVYGPAVTPLECIDAGDLVKE
jgi:Rieske Fe-S protein